MRTRGVIAVYIMANRKNGALYTGVTSDLQLRIYQHREEHFEGFTKRYGVKRLVWFQTFELVTSAIRREHTIKGYPRQWKINLIEAENPEWLDLYETIDR